MKYKVGDEVIYMLKVYTLEKKIYLYKKLAKIIYIDKINQNYLLEFKDYIDGHDGNGLGKKGHCRWIFTEEEVKPLNSLKLKKFIEYGV